MAELVLGNVGAVVGASLLPHGVSLLGGHAAGQAIGQAIGSLAGAIVDARYLTPPVEGPRIREFHLTESREGASLPLVYGRLRVGAQVIWASQFRERREVEGGKGGPRVADYSYSLSFAVALCEGEVSRVVAMLGQWRAVRSVEGDMAALSRDGGSGPRSADRGC